MIVRENKIISDLSVKTFVLLLLTLFFFLVFGIALSYANTLPPDEDQSDIGDAQELKVEAPEQDRVQSRRSIFDMIFNRPAKGDSESVRESLPNPENIEVHEPMKSGKMMQSAKIRIIDKTLGKVYISDKPIGEKYQLNELTVKVRKCWKADEPSLIENSRAVIDVYETNKKIVNKVFSGWIFSAAPAVSQVAHPKYDVTLASCYSEIKVDITPKVEEGE